MQVEKVDFVSFLTQDLARAKRFYSEILELEIETEGENDMEFRAGQVTLDIFDPSSVGRPFAPSPAGLALRVPDTGVCHMAFFRDPDGNSLMLHRRYAPFDDGRLP